MRLNYFNYIYIICTAFISLLLTLSLAGCEMPLPSEKFRPDMLVNNYKTTSYKNDNIEWKLQADKASYYYDEKRTIAINIILDYFKDGRQAAEVKADRAIIYTDSMDIDLMGNIAMTSTTGNKLWTERVKWYNKKGYLDNDEHIRIQRKNGDLIEGDGLRADYNLEKYEIKNNVRAVSSNFNEEMK